jgi:hypothetical protein
MFVKEELIEDVEDKKLKNYVQRVKERGTKDA